MNYENEYKCSSYTCETLGKSLVINNFIPKYEDEYEKDMSEKKIEEKLYDIFIKYESYVE